MVGFSGTRCRARSSCRGRKTGATDGESGGSLMGVGSTSGLCLLGATPVRQRGHRQPRTQRTDQERFPVAPRPTVDRARLVAAFRQAPAQPVQEGSRGGAALRQDAPRGEFGTSSAGEGRSLSRSEDAISGGSGSWGGVPVASAGSAGCGSDSGGGAGLSDGSAAAGTISAATPPAPPPAARGSIRIARRRRLAWRSRLSPNLARLDLGRRLLGAQDGFRTAARAGCCPLPIVSAFVQGAASPRAQTLAVSARLSWSGLSRPSSDLSAPVPPGGWILGIVGTSPSASKPEDETGIFCCCENTRNRFPFAPLTGQLKKGTRTASSARFRSLQARWAQYGLQPTANGRCGADRGPAGRAP